MTQNIKKNTLNSWLIKLTNEEGFFDLQFRRDIRYERPNHPIYYRWKAQFIIVLNKDNKKTPAKIKDVLNCGKICSAKNQIRYAVQDIDNLYNIIVPFFKNERLSERKTRELNLWARAIKIIYRHKGKSLATWNKTDFQNLLKIYKFLQKNKTKNFSKRKWTSIAETIVKTLNN